nr:hypothetical protein Iba_chr12dCG8600 [Ipomoea batatas]
MRLLLLFELNILHAVVAATHLILIPNPNPTDAGPQPHSPHHVSLRQKVSGARPRRRVAKALRGKSAGQQLQKEVQGWIDWTNVEERSKLMEGFAESRVFGSVKKREKTGVYSEGRGKGRKQKTKMEEEKFDSKGRREQVKLGAVGGKFSSSGFLCTACNVLHKSQGMKDCPLRMPNQEANPKARFGSSKLIAL